MSNAFNILGKEGFLRGQGILSLESVQEFYKIIGEEPRNAKTKTENLLDFCNQYGLNELDYFPVILLSKPGNTVVHMVALNNYTRSENALAMKTIDSATESGERDIQCAIITKNGRQELQINQSKDELSLGASICMYFELN